MTSPRRFEQDIPALLAETYLAGMPDYRDDLVQQVARVPQRPAWTFPGRWFPMEIVTTRVPQTRLPWRHVVVLAILVALLAATVAVFVGSQQAVPQPFGPAHNGLVAYAKAGDVYTVDPTTNESTLIVSGRDMDKQPTWSRDGTRLAFIRQTGDGEVVYVVDKDGRNAEPVSDPAVRVSELSFSPDGSTVMFTSGTDTQREIWLAKTTGSPDVRQIDAGMSTASPRFVPPDGTEIVFADLSSVAQGRGLFALSVKTGAVRTILATVPDIFRDSITVSPDGSRIAYSAATEDAVRNTYRVHIVNADGTGDVTLPMPDGAIFQDAPVWSNDGKSLAVTRGYAERNTDMVLAVIPADGSSTGVETERGLTGCCDTRVEWAPDDSVILVVPFDLYGARKQQLLWDPVTGLTRPTAWAADSDPAWQRLAR